MKPRNLISVFQGDAVIEKVGSHEDQRFISLKRHEIGNMKSFCSLMVSKGCTIRDFDGFFVGYSIAQVAKEMDLLRFGQEYILNIEIKSGLKEEYKEQKILSQMKKNFYYLKFLGKPIRIFTYVENDGFYKFNSKSESLEKVNADIVAQSLKEQTVDYSVDPDKEFIPSHYLISPFNSTDRFVAGEYFLTDAQQNIKDEIKKELAIEPFKFFCLSANAGTGKTLLMYDIAKAQIASGKRVKIIHCGFLNEGHEKLKAKYGWDIVSISTIKSDKDKIDLEGIDFIFVDESQRIHSLQLKALVESAKCKRIPVFFSYDPKQYLRDGETLDLSEYLNDRYPNIPLSKKKLTNKIRTNKALASFINNLLKIGRSKDNLDYGCITIEYMGNFETLKSYIAFLETIGWTPITFTNSQYTTDPYDKLACVCTKNAHAVIGQEFSKVVFVMDDNFEYREDGKLFARKSYYSAEGMLYQIATRVVDELKIVVTNNPKLYIKLLEIKALGE